MRKVKAKTKLIVKQLLYINEGYKKMSVVFL